VNLFAVGVRLKQESGQAIDRHASKLVWVSAKDFYHHNRLVRVPVIGRCGSRPAGPVVNYPAER
jgi:hypothetical protein